MAPLLEQGWVSLVAVGGGVLRCFERGGFVTGEVDGFEGSFGGYALEFLGYEWGEGWFGEGGDGWV